MAVVLPDGTSSFQHLQNVLGGVGGDGVLKYFVFDLLFEGGRDWTREPLHLRKARLAGLLEAVPPASALKYSDHVEGHGPEFHAQACRLGLEGIISKRRDSPYRSGRNRDWLKVKCLAVDEFVIGGYTEPGGSRVGLGALLLGGHDAAGRLRFAGRVGTGFTDALLTALGQRLSALETEDSPFADGPTGRAARGMHWVEPTLVAQVAYTDWTADGLLRHPRFRGLREDLEAGSVPLPRARGERDPLRGRAPAPAPEPDPSRASSSAEPEVGRPVPTRTGQAASSRSRARRPRGSAKAPIVAGIPVTNPDKVLYPDAGVTKLELAEYYEAVADRMLPWVGDRPLTLLRCPNGIGDCFFQKHIEGTVPEGVLSVQVGEGDERGEYPVVDSAAGLVALAQLGVLEIHTWGSRRQDLERPDRFTLDFDPDEGLAWIRVVEAVLEMRGFLGEIGLQSFLKTTGGKGLHVVVPIVPGPGWDEVKEFTRAVGATVAGDHPGRYTLSLSKERRRGRILIDYLRNGRGATAIEAYSTRARPGATVAVPVRWEELAEGIRPDGFDVRNVLPRLDRQGEEGPWSAYLEVRQSITTAMKKAVGLA